MAAAEGLTCKCGHPKLKHAFLRGRCTHRDGCDCVQFEAVEGFALLDTALSLDEQLEVVRREVARLRLANRLLLAESELPDDEKALREKLLKARTAFERIVADPTSTRATVQTIALKMLQEL